MHSGKIIRISLTGRHKIYPEIVSRRLLSLQLQRSWKKLTLAVPGLNKIDIRQTFAVCLLSLRTKLEKKVANKFVFHDSTLRQRKGGIGKLHHAHGSKPRKYS